MTQVEISGLKETVRALSRLGVESDDLRDTFSSISQRVADRAKSMVWSPSGRNRASIRGSRRKNAAVVTFNRRDKGRQVGSYIFFGANGAPQPRFIWHAVDAIGEDAIRRDVETGLNQAIARAGLR